MSFDAIELLNAFDIIKNETLYSNRLQKLADAQAELTKSEYIVKTVEIAQARFDEANRLLEQARVRMVNLDREVEETRKKKLEDVVKLEAALDKRTKELDQLASKLNTQRQELMSDQVKLTMGQKALALTSSEYEERRTDLNKKEEVLMFKLEQLRKVIES